MVELASPNSLHWGCALGQAAQKRKHSGVGLKVQLVWTEVSRGSYRAAKTEGCTMFSLWRLTFWP